MRQPGAKRTDLVAGERFECERQLIDVVLFGAFARHEIQKGFECDVARLRRIDVGHNTLKVHVALAILANVVAAGDE